MSRWGGEHTCGIGCAVADSPAGPFTNQGKLFRSNEIGVQNSIDLFYIEENGEKYLFWGSFRGIYYIELSEDGLHIRPGAKPTQIAGTAYEAVYVHKKGKYYYLFASIGSCCQGEKSTYTTVVGRSESLFGPYMDKNGNSMLDNHHEVVIHPNASFAGTGHNAEIMTDKKGDDWILYHAYIRDKADVYKRQGNTSSTRSPFFQVRSIRKYSPATGETFIRLPFTFTCTFLVQEGIRR